MKKSDEYARSAKNVINSITGHYIKRATDRAYRAAEAVTRKHPDIEVEITNSLDWWTKGCRQFFVLIFFKGESIPAELSLDGRRTSEAMRREIENLIEIIRRDSF